jgi:hypothetical protein
MRMRLALCGVLLRAVLQVLHVLQVVSSMTLRFFARQPLPLVVVLPRSASGCQVVSLFARLCWCSK